MQEACAHSAKYSLHHILHAACRAIHRESAFKPRLGQHASNRHGAMHNFKARMHHDSFFPNAFDAINLIAYMTCLACANSIFH
ncbi:hypothetical protein Pnap_1408 [Polaromonas naphthalenivorans CJ2]|uniref:Uncharacterized protein n=1 Tax=Polaromonas naphthalenivorans (strain CJ2) TaxID=365044 RepID=A1VM44_POLNA|nr:hypothetical protein Pnap_1408 [Polaromonas naphthalenivorans CJ2]